MQSATRDRSESKGLVWSGRAVSALVVLLLLMDAVMKIIKAPAGVEGTVRLGYPESVLVGIGIALLVSTILYAVPPTSVLGAILLTGYLGGAVATNVRVGNPLFGYILFPVYVGVFAWGGLFLRDQRLRTLIPLRKK